MQQQWWERIGRAEPPAAVFVRRVRELRDGIGLTQRDLAAKMADLGMQFHPSTIARIETGKRSVNIDELVALAFVLGVRRIDTLVDDSARAQGASYRSLVTAAEQSVRRFAEQRRDLIDQRREVEADLERAQHYLRELRDAGPSGILPIETKEVDHG